MIKRLLLGITLVLAVLSARAQSFDFKKEFPLRPLPSWTPGMRFLMPADASGFGDCPLMVLKGATFKGTDLYGTSPDDKALAGLTFTFQRLDAFKDLGHDGKGTGSGTDQVAVVFKASNGKQYAYIVNTPLAVLKKENREIGAPCLVPLDDVEKARKLLVGQTVYVLQQYMSASSTRDDVQYLPKFAPVKITKVGPGQGRRPVRLTFEYVSTTPRQVQEQDYILSGTNTGISYGGGSQLPEVFGSCFSFQDPRAAAGVAKDTDWNAIRQGQLVKGMSMKEVEMAMGKPKHKAENMSTDRMTVWHYSRFQGKEWELLFKNGILDSYTNYQN